MNVKKSSKHFNPKYLFLVLHQKEGKGEESDKKQNKKYKQKKNRDEYERKKSLSRSYRSTLIAIYTYIHT